jgi:hypothetical protein
MDSSMILIYCPHCNCSILIEQINCGIFRCGILKENGTQIPPHASKTVCDELLSRELIWGCGKPFQIQKINAQIQDEQKTLEQYRAVVCDYI